MAISGSRVTVGATATALNTAGSTQNLTILNSGTGDLDLGGASVASGAGFKLAAGSSITVTVFWGAVLYAVHATSGQASVLSTGS